MSTYRDYLVEYPFDGATWALTISAQSHAEAEARVKALPWATVKGELAVVIPLTPASALQRFMRWLRGAA